MHTAHTCTLKSLTHTHSHIFSLISSVRRTKVIDDESDYFKSSNQWLTDKERDSLQQREAELKEIRYGSRLNRKVTFDFAGRQIVEEEPLIGMCTHLSICVYVCV